MEAVTEAVRVRGAYKAYGSGEKRNVVLEGLNMNVPTGAIYGLLGASGSGKTTLLAAVAGLRPLDKGEIQVLGSPPFTGPAIGYMPQEIALMPDFSISDTLFYFGRIMGMNADQIRARHDVLAKLLELPSKGKFVGKLSGGQQRRVSLAVAMLHDPELLILDEPTVGLDPLLRNRIWDYLMQITRQYCKTIIITTHYIEEARQSDVVGLMRGGRLLAEAPPETLLTRYECSSLEQTFLLLSEKQHAHRIQQQQGQSLPSIEFVQPPELVLQPEALTELSSKNPVRKATRWSIMHALLLRNFLRFIRSPGSVAFGFGFAVLQMSLFYIAIGVPPTGLRLAVVNEETHLTPCDPEIDVPSCDSTRLSCRFMAALNKNTFDVMLFPELNQAEDTVRAGKAWALIHFGPNFTEALRERERLGKDIDDDTLTQSEIAIRLDMSDGQIGSLVTTEIRDAFRTFFDELLVSCNVSTRHGQIPLRINEPIYGKKEFKFLTSIVPGTIITVVYFLAISLTTFSVLADRLEGIWSRTIVSGATEYEVLASHGLTQSVVVVVQVLEVMFISFLVFRVENTGSLWLIFLMLLLQGICGMFYGLLISLLCNQVRTADSASMGSIVPVYMICGVLWPVEGIPTPLRQVSQVLPVTSGVSALTSIMYRGLGLNDPAILLGFIFVAIWCVIGSVICVLVILRKRH